MYEKQCAMHTLYDCCTIYKYHLQVPFTSTIYKYHLQVPFTSTIYKYHLQVPLGKLEVEKIQGGGLRFFRERLRFFSGWGEIFSGGVKIFSGRVEIFCFFWGGVEKL